MKKLIFILVCGALFAFTTFEQMPHPDKDGNNVQTMQGVTVEQNSGPIANGLHVALFPVLPQEQTIVIGTGLFTDPRCNCIGCSTDANGVRYCCYDTGGGIICLPE